MARQNSVANSNFTLVAIRTQGPGALSAYCLLDLSRNADGTFGAWTQITPWKYLPKGVIFENQTSIDTYMSTPSSSLQLPMALSNVSPVLMYQGSPVDLTSSACVVQCYLPDGTMAGGNPLRLRLIEGSADASGTITYQGATSSGTDLSYYDVYFVANTGLTKIVRN
jgi:hypothetical protein